MHSSRVLRLVAATALVASGLASASAGAEPSAMCQMLGHFHSVDSTRALVRDAPAIVRARARGYANTTIAKTPSPLASTDSFLLYGLDHGARPIAFEILEVLKGPLKGGVPGDSSLRRGAQVFFVGWLRRSHHGSPEPVPRREGRNGGGSCVDQLYVKGTEYLFILSRDTAGRFTPHAHPLAPTNEPLRGKRDPWLRWVRQEVSRLSSEERK